MENRRQSMWLKCLFLLEALIIGTQVLGQNDITSSLFLLTFPLTVILWLRSLQNVLQPGDLLIILTSVLALVNVLLNFLVTNTSFSISYFNKLIMFIMSLMFLQAASRIKIGQKTARFILRTVDVLAIFLILMLLITEDQMYMLNGIKTRYLVFQFNNPNMTGLVLTCMFIVELSEVFGKQGFWSRAVHILLSVALVVMIIMTESRNALIVFSIFTLSCLWLLWKKPKRLTVKKIVAACVSIFPLIFAIVYRLLVFNKSIQDVLSFLIQEGKLLDSRVVVWERGWDFFKESPIIGAYSQSTDGTGYAQFHNTHLDVLISYGPLVLLLVCVFLYMIIYSKGRVYNDKESYIYKLGFICVLILGIGEAALFSGGLGIYIFMGILLILSNRRQVEGWEPST